MVMVVVWMFVLGWWLIARSAGFTAPITDVKQKPVVLCPFYQPLPTRHRDFGADHDRSDDVPAPPESTEVEAAASGQLSTGSVEPTDSAWMISSAHGGGSDDSGQLVCPRRSPDPDQNHFGWVGPVVVVSEGPFPISDPGGDVFCHEDPVSEVPAHPGKEAGNQQTAAG